jgi:hypothetical protein
MPHDLLRPMIDLSTGIPTACRSDASCGCPRGCSSQPLIRLAAARPTHHCAGC